MIYAAKLKPGMLYQTVVDNLILCYLDLRGQNEHLGHEESSFHSRHEYFMFVETLSGKQLETRFGKKFTTSLERRYSFHHFVGKDMNYWFTEWSINKLRLVWLKN